MDETRRVVPWPVALAIALGLAFAGADAARAQDALRGQRLYNDTAAAVGQDVGRCAECHADVDALREMIRNHGGRTDDARAVARWLKVVIDGAQPGARNAKAQFRGVLTPQDLQDIGAYLSRRAVSQVLQAPRPDAEVRTAEGSCPG